MRELLKRQSIVLSKIADGTLWILGLAFQIGGWTSHYVAYVLFGIAFIGAIFVIYWAKHKRQERPASVSPSKTPPTTSIDLQNSRLDARGAKMRIRGKDTAIRGKNSTVDMRNADFDDDRKEQ